MAKPGLFPAPMCCGSETFSAGPRAGASDTVSLRGFAKASPHVLSGAARSSTSAARRRWR